MSSIEERLRHVEHFLGKSLSEKEKKEYPKTCIICQVGNKQKDKIYSSNLNSAWIISADIVLQYCKKKGITKCNHKNTWLCNESISLTNKISDLLCAKSEDKYNSLELFKVLDDYLDKDNAPLKLQKIINTVGKNWIKSLDPFDYDFGYQELVKKHGEGVMEGLMVPPSHPNIFRTARQWADACDCEECQDYWVEKKLKIEEAEKELKKK